MAPLPGKAVSDLFWNPAARKVKVAFVPGQNSRDSGGKSWSRPKVDTPVMAWI